MEHAPRNGQFTPQEIGSINPHYQQEIAAQRKRERSRRWLRERVERERKRLAVFMVMAHGIVNMSLSAERNKQVRGRVTKQLQDQYGLQAPVWWRR
ncbi:MAG TPA: hypothetical protein VLH38_01660 [Patescibacteria group bacterium]|nr:hypothetical protein [Patescibacteria group bacterium]